MKEPVKLERYSTNIGPVEPKYLDSAGAARYLGLKNSMTLAIWRKNGYGPPFVPIGRRGSNRYLYDKDDLDKWIEEQKLYPQHPHGLQSNKEGALSPSNTKARKPKSKPKKPQPSDESNLHLVFRTASERKP